MISKTFLVLLRINIFLQLSLAREVETTFKVSGVDLVLQQYFNKVI